MLDISAYIAYGIYTCVFVTFFLCIMYNLYNNRKKQVKNNEKLLDNI